MKRFFRASAALLALLMLLCAPGCMITEIVTSIQAEGDATFKFCDSGALYRWGAGEQFGAESTAAPVIFDAVPGAFDFAFADEFAVWLTRDGVAVTGNAGYLPVSAEADTWIGSTLLSPLNSTGLDSEHPAYELVDVDFTDARQVAAGKDFALVLLADGSLYGFGADTNMALLQYVNEEPQDIYGIVRLEVLDELGGLSQISAAPNGQCSAITKSGMLVTWGGDSGYAGSTVFDAAVFTQTASAGDFVIALAEDGTVWQKQGNEHFKREELSDVVSVAAGDGFALAVTRSGEVWSWGKNDESRLGRADTADNSVPAPVEGINGVIAISCGRAHTVALRKDGTVWVWGAGAAGQLGTAGEDSLVPLKLPEQQAKVDIRS
ncbi:MAG: hypothetical protein IKL99_06905 [Oscillospiraceae bacterium]|nr:hypothetical protein [Oscillospiraceae bacterium]